jgi:hypothetical protein
MRKYLIITATIVLLGFSNLIALTNSNANSATSSNMPGYVTYYNCLEPGGTCGWAVTSDTRIDPIPEIANAYRVTIEFQEITNTMGFTIENNFTFPQGFKMEIIECEDYPSVINQKVDLSGKTVAINGTITVQLIISQ